MRILDIWRARRKARDKTGHRTTACGCKFWIGDRGFPDMGTCKVCKP